MRGLIMTIGPEETNQRIIMLKLLMALEKGHPEGIRVPLVHRVLRQIRNNIEGAKTENIHPILRPRFAFETGAGRFPAFEYLLGVLACCGTLRVEEKDEAEFVVWLDKAGENLADIAKRLCELRTDEEKVLTELGEYGARRYRDLLSQH